MNAQAPSTTTVHRGPIHALAAGFAALVLAGATMGVIAITSNDNGKSTPASVTNIAPERVLDGSPILRGTEPSAALSRDFAYRHAMAPSYLRTAGSAGTVSVLDGSPILRGHAAAKAVTHASSVQGTLRSPAGGPRGFGYVP